MIVKQSAQAERVCFTFDALPFSLRVDAVNQESERLRFAERRKKRRFEHLIAEWKYYNP